MPIARSRRTALGFAPVLLLAASSFFTSPDARAACTGCAKPSFGPSGIPFPAANAAAVGDFNTDGRVDLAATEFSGSATAITLHTTTAGGGFLETFRVSLPEVTQAVLKAGDFDRDGRLDLLVLTNGPGLLLLRGDGAGAFAAPVAVATVSFGPLAVADFDGDGRLDAATGDNGQIRLFRGLGDGTFQVPSSIPFEGAWIGVLVAGDVDGDGRPDLVAGDANHVSVYRNGSSGFVVAHVSFEPSDPYGGLALADVDGDGIPDLLTGGNGIGVRYGLGDGRFLPVVGMGAGSFSSMAIGDFNRDGRADVLASRRVYLSDNYGVLQPAATLPTFGGGVVGDFDGDGNLDIGTSGAFYFPGAPSPGALYLGNGDGSFTSPRSLATGSARNLTVLDVNKDGKPDLAWMSSNSAFGTILGDGNGGFSSAIMTTFAVPYFDGVFADVTGDGIPDAVVTASATPPATLYVLPGDGSGRFGVPIVTTFGFSSQIGACVVADFDADGYADVAFLLDGQLRVLFGDGTGHFPRSKPPTTIPLASLRVSDLNADGRPDLVLFSSDGYRGEVRTLLNDGTGGFASGAGSTFVPPDGTAVLVTDLDGDGRPDLLTTSSVFVTFRRGDGAGGFGAPIDSATPEAWRLVAADFDGDGIVDVFTSFQVGSVLKGRGDGTFEFIGSYPLPPFGLLVGADLTGDGRPDVLDMDYSGTWLLPNTTCEPRRLLLDPWPVSCGTAGVPFATQPTLRVVDDAGNPLACESSTVTASIAAGPAGASLGGTTTAPLVGGVATFTNLSVGQPGGGYVVRFDLSGAHGAATPAFSQSLPAPPITGPGQMCSGSAARFEGPEADAWTWTLDGNTVGSSRVLTLSAIPVGSHALALAIRSGECASSTSRSLSVSSPVPTPVATSNSAVPFGGILQLSASAIPGATFRWTGPNGFTSAVQNPAIPYATESDTGRYTVVATVGTCVSGPAFTDVVVVPPLCSGCPNASFSNAVRALRIPPSARGIALADFDGDGLLDVVTAHADSGSTVSFLGGDGRGGFSPALPSTSGASSAGSLVAGDLDGNGLRDLVSNAWSSVSVVLQTSPGRFGRAHSINLGGLVTALVLADLNGDGHLDLAATVSGGGGFGEPYRPGKLAVLLGDGAGGFAPPSFVPTELQPSSLVARDTNGDGLTDLLVANMISETVSVFLGDGHGTFTLQSTLAVPGQPVALAVGDVTGDVAPDLVVGVAGTIPSAVLFAGSPSGSFVFVRTFPIASDGRLRLVDLDGDGRPDLVTAATHTVLVYLGKGAGDFGPPSKYPVGGDIVDFSLEDYDSDGRADVVVLTDSRVALLKGDGRGGLSSLPALGPFAEPPKAASAADLDADGRPDVLVLVPRPYPPAIEVFLSRPEGPVLAATLRPPDHFVLDAFTTGDVDGDGRPDVVGVDRSGSLFVFRNLGTGAFAPPVETDVGGTIVLLAAGDVNGDGRLDVVLADGYSIRPPTVYFGSASSTFGGAAALPGNAQVTKAAVGDFTGDGRGEVLALSINPLAVIVFPWTGTTFAPGVQRSLDQAPNAVAIADFDRDGTLDAVVSVAPLYGGTLSTPGLRFLRGSGGGAFASPVAFGPKDILDNLVAADFDQDAAPDLAGTVGLLYASSVAVFRGDGHGAFADGVEFMGGNGLTLFAADLGGDGKQDLAVTRSTPPDVAFLVNSTCVPSRLGVTANPSCTSLGQPFALDVAVLDDGGNVVPCASGDVQAQLLAGTGTPGAALSGATSVPVTSGSAHFGALSIDRDGRRYRLELTHPLASRTWSAPFNVGATPDPAITGPQQLCAGTSVYSAPAGYDTYVWTVDGNPVSYARSLTPAFLPAGGHSLGLSVTRDRCPSQTSVSISNAPPTLTSLSPNHGLSQGGTFVTLTAACVAPGAAVALGGVAAISADPPDQATLHVVTGGHTPVTVSAVVTNPDGQAGTLPSAYTYECDTKVPKLTSNSPVCAGGWISINAPSFAGASYAWTGPNGFTATTSYVFLPGATPAQSGTYTVTISNVFGCTLPSASATVVVNPSPSSAITAPGSVTAWSTGNTASVPDAGAGASYSWWISAGNATITSGWNSRTVTFDAGVAGTIGLSVNVYGASCGAYGSTTIPIDPKPTALQPITPCRVLDTRLPDGPRGGPVLSAGSPGRRFPIAGTCGVPADAVAVAANVTVTSPTSPGFLRVHAGSTPSPPTSNLNFGAGQTRAGSSIIMLGSDGSVIVESGQPSGSVHVILDVSGYFR